MSSQLDRIERKLDKLTSLIIKGDPAMAQDLSALKSEVAAASAADPALAAELAALSAQIKADSSGLAAAVAQNTPAAPVAPPVAP